MSRKSGRSGVSGVSGGSGKSGKSGKSGQSGPYGKSGQSGYVLQNQMRARAMFLAYVIASMRATSKKLHGTDAPLKGTSYNYKEVRTIEQSTTFKRMKRCECTAALDSSTLELYALCMSVEAVVRLIYAILLCKLFCGFGLLSLFLSEYGRGAGTSCRSAVLRKYVDEQLFQQIVRSCKLGTATREARVSRPSTAHKVRGESGKYSMAEVGARYMGEAINKGHAKQTSETIAKASTEGAVTDALEDCWVVNPFLQYLIYRDMQQWNFEFTII